MKDKKFSKELNKQPLFKKYSSIKQDEVQKVRYIS
jgi:hypothetical protein